MPRKKHIYHYLYKTTNMINNKYYYGMHSTSNMNDGYLGSGTYLRRAILKHGKEKFRIEILQFFDTRDELINAEKDLITFSIIENNLCMNLKPGGAGGFKNENHRIKFQKAGHEGSKNKWANNIEYRNKITALSSKRMEQHHKNGKINYNTFTGKTHKLSSKKKIGEKNAVQQLGSKNSQFGTCWIIKNNISKKIKIEELDTFINLGWIKGRKIKKTT